MRTTVRSRTPPPIRSARDVRALLWPIARRMPAYLRLGWRLGREPAIAKRHKALLVSAALYTITPAHVVMNAVPILGQIDSVVLFLVGLRQALRHCPPEIAAAHLARVRLQRGQLDDDLRTVLYVAQTVAHKAGNFLGRNLRFAGRVAAGFGRRTLRRMTDSETQRQ